MIRNFLAMTMGALLMACATVKTPTAAPARDPDNTILAAVGIFECGDMKGIIVVTKSGKIVPANDTDTDDLEAIAKTLAPQSAGAINLGDNCPPTQKTRT